MIFVSLGTHTQPFTRAIEKLTQLDTDERILVQHGATPVSNDLPNSEWREFMSFDEVVEAMSQASAVVCHCGVGTIMTALRAGKTPVVLPRLSRFGEHVDDHQLQIAREFAGIGLIQCCGETDSLHDAVQAVRDRPYPTLPQSGRLRQAVAAAAGR